MTTEQRLGFEIVKMPEIWTPQYLAQRGLRVGLAKEIVSPVNTKGRVSARGIQRLAGTLADQFELRRYSQGENIYQQGDIVDGFYSLQRGEIGAYRNDRLMNMSNRAGAFSNRLDLVRDRRIVTLRAETESDLLFLPNDAVKELRDESQSVYRAMRKIIQGGSTK